MNHVKLLTLSFLLICLFHPGLTLKCFQCKTESDPNCKDPSKLTAITCHQNIVVPACLKSSALNMETNELEIERACTFAPQNNNNACQVKSNKLNHAKKYKNIQCNLCNTDGCNDDSPPTGAGNLAGNSHYNLMLASIIVLFSLQRICY